MPGSENRLFFPQSALDEWIVDGRVELHDGEMSILSEGRCFRLTEAVHVIQEVTGSGDAAGLVGRTKSRAQLEQMGAEIVETSMLLGDTAYDIAPGWFGVPVGKPAGPKSDEELLLGFAKS